MHESCTCIITQHENNEVNKKNKQEKKNTLNAFRQQNKEHGVQKYTDSTPPPPNRLQTNKFVTVCIPR